jgi:undecaprenyl-diphosphatase
MTRLSAFRFWSLLAGLVGLFAAMLVLGGPSAHADRAILIATQVDALVNPARLVTRGGDWWFVLVVGAIGAAWLLLKRLWRRAALLALLLLTERTIVEFLKLVFDRARPDPAGHKVAVHSLAFPSGHSANAMVLGLALALLLPMSPRARTAALAAAFLYAFGIGATRLVLGAHWPSDVVGGWALGALWTLLVVRLAAGTDEAQPH